ncbi:MAG TPA: FAD-binding oxidoreductase [Albitalea sp.]|uniref:FAD-binding oxidoreductase n=1 Tax=Piscinibacter sp. TaxID=1903157 RepID=UPI002ED3DEBF
MNARVPESASIDAAPAWQGDEPLRCVQVRQETHDVKTFVLQAEPPRRFRHLPGQFITLALEIAGAPVNRCYTLSSTPTRPDRASITVKRVPGGVVSNWLHDQLRVGDRLVASGPSGRFSCFAHPAERRLFLSGGSGITPLMSMSRALHDLASDADVVFVHCARTPGDVLFAGELAQIARELPHFRVALVCEQRGADAAWSGYMGRLNAGLLPAIAPDFLERDVYTCGPAPFMAGVRAMLETAGYEMQRYREESFSFDAAPIDVPAASSDGADFVVRLSRLGHEFRCGSDERLLAAAQRAGLRLPFSCSSGVCGTCKTRKLSGEVEMSHGGGIRPREIEQGFILPCCSRPLSDVVLDR